MSEKDKWIAKLESAIRGLMGPALLGSQTDDELMRDWGGLGMSHIKEARAIVRAIEVAEGTK